ncbi:2-phospho-L-lactate transferase [Niveispirillum sp.]|uniref:2-phospho-L-lactate transferase n=1 Tax=Niveispirillum sp. TaxID=1917217 RepID=UPI001B5EA27B|nr:2-phospho-L-lactate transferase [Niveispirillum sp.]MBP7338457.1 2-phospho-L-lactate transferase [Niveispirillum sp.]
MMAFGGKVLALAGGVGGARMAAGLARALPAGALTVAVNVGDDFDHLGLHVAPDLDTVTYTLAGINNPAQGWGIAGETTAFMGALKRLGGPDWFLLGDQDMATHVLRTLRLKAGESLSAITADFARRLGITTRIVPMSDDPVRSIVDTDEGTLPFQDYFVRRQCIPRFHGIRFDGLETARPSAGLVAALRDPDLSAIIICPSNPILSIWPILGVSGVHAALSTASAPVIAVSPFIGAKAVKGPAGKIFAELNLDPSPAGLLSCYDGLVDGLVMDHADADRAGNCGDVALRVTDILMRDGADQEHLALEILDFAAGLRAGTGGRDG